ncbi:MAG: glycosyltransferase family A protein [Pseudomonadota bacterium]
MTTVTTIIPVYNDQGNAEKAVASVLAQTRPSDEIIVVDDGSEQPFVLSPDAREKNVRIIRQENKGPAAARNTGITSASGDYLAFLDSDDTWLPMKLEQQLACISALPKNTESLTICATGFSISGHYTSRKRTAQRALIPLPASSVEQFAMGCWYCPGSTLMAHRNVFQAVGQYDATLRRYEDYEFGLRLAIKGGSVAVCSTVLSAISPRIRHSELSPYPSVEAIRARYCTALEQRSSKALSKLEAFLELECAASHWRQKRYATMSRHLIRSLFHQPRLRTQVHALWRDAGAADEAHGIANPFKS